MGLPTNCVRGIVMLGVDSVTRPRVPVRRHVGDQHRAGLNGMPGGNITEPAPGDFYRVSNIDDMLFAFDSLNPEPGVPQRKGRCASCRFAGGPPRLRAGPVDQVGEDPGSGGTPASSRT
ncbi:hypothetical protein BZL30_9406 [Mycobacterium kansasii]|uniref:Uncharacterized protein n=1 Tax=Mycobacterium kansasii TaxID=1768 RepID=A0A1V3WBT9_MYCKA|nr:hypothetical protein BZL30_9406 [Mycobacterium kansasii]